MSNLIIALSAKKQGGKNTTVNFLLANSHLFWPGHETKVFSFAAPFKKFCVEVLGLAHEQVYGTDQEKNSLTAYYWEKLPHYQQGMPTGPMTARQVMQEIGTGIFRRMNEDIWVQTALRNIREWQGSNNNTVAFLDDCRFPNEVKGVQQAGGIVIRLSRDVAQGDQHESERALDPVNYNWSNFDVVVDNNDCTIEMQNIKIFNSLRRKCIFQEPVLSSVNWKPNA